MQFNEKQKTKREIYEVKKIANLQRERFKGKLLTVSIVFFILVIWPLVKYTYNIIWYRFYIIQFGTEFEDLSGTVAVLSKNNNKIFLWFGILIV